ncbi:MAG: hypothetical protein M1817_006498 [Caeruleum heppii]|nr:MAG: hypothetical protein M1817_006498 [Caeruleum heppii]
MAPFFQNRSCDPFTSRSQPCEFGNYVRYALNVTRPEDISKGLRFARDYNIRIVVRNTGHDYNGKSTGAGSLAIWTHHLKDISFMDNFRGAKYSGPAMKVGAGVQVSEAYDAADKKGRIVVGGECTGVGLAGGYTQGGGHSAVLSKFGLSADQTLEWEVVTADGTLVTANRQKNSDLYWALSGGGGGTFGIVYSLTVKTYPDMPVTGAIMNFTNEGIKDDDYYRAIEVFHSVLPNMTDAGATIVDTYTNASFAVTPFFGPGLSKEQVDALFQPFWDALEALGIKYSAQVTSFPSYLSAFNALFAPIPVGIAQYGGRLIPRSVVEQKNSQVTEAVRYITEQGGLIFEVVANASLARAGDVDNAVLPAWRDVLLDMVVTSAWNNTAPWAEMIANQVKMTDDWMPKLKAISPSSGTYMNEGDFRDPDWKSAFYGKNYDRLRSIKAKYDPNNVFYATTAVGSDYWKVEADGRLCQA